MGTREPMDRLGTIERSWLMSYSKILMGCVLPGGLADRIYTPTACDTEIDATPRFEDPSFNEGGFHLNSILENSVLGFCNHATPMGENGDSPGLEIKKISAQERNRLSAMRARQRKKAWIKELEEQIQDLHSQNLMLMEENHKLRDNIMRWHSIFYIHCRVWHFKDGMRGFQEGAAYSQDNL
jgi:hypothetical protein